MRMKNQTERMRLAEGQRSFVTLSRNKRLTEQAAAWMREIRTSERERSFEKLRRIRKDNGKELKESVDWIQLARRRD
jgi:hypothetical protein